jgi:uncharacterized FAD-dependent dehydrogenase
MITKTDLTIPPSSINDKEFLYSMAAKKLGRDLSEITAVITEKRSVDARGKFPVYVLSCSVFVNESPPKTKNIIKYNPVTGDKKAIVVGFGPAGMYASLRLIELGIRPIVFERGKDVRSRRRDLRQIQQFDTVNPDSNYCFGEGGAGTYSDGKLYTRATKRGDTRKILSIMVQHGADPDILVDSHPHVGSNKLPGIVQKIRETVLKNLGEVHFNSRVTDLLIKNGKIEGIIVNDKEEYTADAVIVATGHSARDIFYIYHKHNILLEPKSFAMGVRIEHPQELINKIQYHSELKDPNLPAASYNLACNIEGKGVYSFCMCPGGIVVPAATAPGEIVVNGMSLSQRDSPFANSGFVVAVDEKDWAMYEDKYPFSALHLQMEVEHVAFELANKTLKAPAQRLTDFMNDRLSSDLPLTSYIPGLTSAPLHESLPRFIVKGLKKGVNIFNTYMKGYYSEEAQIIAIESRTSSPIRVIRDRESFMNLSIEGLFPAGEGAGYAGGIVSAALDGENCASAVAKYLIK